MFGGTAFGIKHFESKGWRAEVQTGPISRDAEVDALKDSLGAANIPEQLFGDNYLRLTHQASGTAIEFNAADALRAWHADNLPPVQVQIASQWQRSRKDAISKVAALNYDWTYTTSYSGSIRMCDPADAAQQSEQQEAADQQQHQQQPSWQASSDQLDMAQLTARDPILFYAEVPIYESELDDNGSSQLSVKARFMPNCWYVLMRFFLRVDGTLVRLRDARIFCDLRCPDKVVREVKHMEATLAELSGSSSGPTRGVRLLCAIIAGATATGNTVTLAANFTQMLSLSLWHMLRHTPLLMCLPDAPSCVNAPSVPAQVAHADADSAALALSAIAPDGVKSYRTETLLL